MFGVEKVDATRTPVSPTRTHLYTHSHTHTPRPDSSHSPRCPTHTRLDNQYIRCTFPFVRHGPSGHNNYNHCTTTTTLLQAQKRCVYVLGVCPASLPAWQTACRVSMSMFYPFAVLHELTVHSNIKPKPTPSLTSLPHAPSSCCTLLGAFHKGTIWPQREQQQHKQHQQHVYIKFSYNEIYIAHTPCWPPQLITKFAF